MGESSDNSPPDGKSDARDSRLGYIRKTEEEAIRKRLIAEANEKCQDFYHAFGECAKANGVLVVLKCRRENLAISTCIETHYNEDVFQKYIQDRGLKVRP
mmetsp:Transcript_22451/g.32750  ORF Transcript_22451/g.32750 Transcript_22451/m.32750 type:complete len:100 (-) Transcript_22451:203-502(-)